MKALASILPVALLLAAVPAWANPVSEGTVREATACIRAASDVHRVPAGLIAVILSVEGGTLGRVSQNTNATVDIGPMQINQIHLPALARRWNTTADSARGALLGSFCANVEAGAWLLRREIDGAGGDFWEGVGRYHSRTPHFRDRYLRKVLEHIQRLQAVVSRTVVAGTP